MSSVLSCVLSEPQQKLCEMHIRLAYSKMNEYREKYSVLDDIEGICLESLVETARRYDENRDLRFSTLYAKIVYRWVCGDLRKYYRNNRCDISVDLLKEKKIELPSFIPNSDEYEAILYTRRLLSKRDKQIWKMLALGKSKQQIARMLRMSESRINSRVSKIKSLLVKELCN